MSNSSLSSQDYLILADIVGVIRDQGLGQASSPAR